MSGYTSRKELQDAVYWAGSAANFIFDGFYDLSPDDLPDGTPEAVREAVARLVTEGAADLETFADWLQGTEAGGPYAAARRADAARATFPAEAANSPVQVWRCGCRYRQAIKDCEHRWVRIAVCTVHENETERADECPHRSQDPGLLQNP